MHLIFFSPVKNILILPVSFQHYAVKYINVNKKKTTQLEILLNPIYKKKSTLTFQNIFQV